MGKQGDLILNACFVDTLYVSCLAYIESQEFHCQRQEDRGERAALSGPRPNREGLRLESTVTDEYRVETQV